MFARRKMRQRVGGHDVNRTPNLLSIGVVWTISALDDLFDAKAVAEADLPRRFLPRRLTRLDICLNASNVVIMV